MKTSNMFKSLFVATAVILGNAAYAEGDSKCGPCSAEKAIEAAKAQGMIEFDSLSYSLGNWTIEGTDKDGNNLSAKVHCPQVKDSKAELVKIGSVERIPINEIVKKVEKLSSGKIASINFNGIFWTAVVVDETVELEFRFDKQGRLKGQLVID